MQGDRERLACECTLVNLNAALVHLGRGEGVCVCVRVSLGCWCVRVRVHESVCLQSGRERLALACERTLGTLNAALVHLAT